MDAKSPAQPVEIEPRKRGGSGAEGLPKLHRQYPTIADLRKRARRRVPRFAFDFVDGGCGENTVRDSNRVALDAVKLVARYGLGSGGISTEIELFGRRYAAPIGISPMGMGGLLWPKAERHLARAAQAMKVPYVLSTPASASIEEISKIAPDVFWFQLYGSPGNDNRITFDLVRRAEAAGAHALVVTIDTPVRAKRPQDWRNNLAVPFKPTIKTVIDIATSPLWALEVLRQGTPCPENFRAYAGPNATNADISACSSREMRGGFAWETIERVRKLWPRTLIIKGIIHPDDAMRALTLGADGVIVSNHGGRTLDAAPPAIDILPAVVERVGHRITVLMDSGIRTGLDVVRALALGAKCVFTGRSFLFGVAALGEEGGTHVLEFFSEEIRMAMGQVGARSIAALPQATVIHPGALKMPFSGANA
ncbi:MAG TPA: alpha-hydroxy acid oxidase [Stellaceae bacterium]|nr:alpha-hydroxy acid oxidase [Stellaceae bacterium]